MAMRTADRELRTWKDQVGGAAANPLPCSVQRLGQLAGCSRRGCCTHCCRSRRNSSKHGAARWLRLSECVAVHG